MASMHWAVAITLFALAVEPPATPAAFRPEQIYGAAFMKRRVRFRAKLKVGDRDEPIQSRVALNALATAVADRYKQRHLELIATAEGRNRLWAAEGTVL